MGETGNLTMGSLFDGAGGFPLAGRLAGIKTVWNSEIEPFPIRVTTRRFPEVKHYGNITEMSGYEIEPVDIITFGSPCQDLSVAGKRKGLAGERSGLFLEAIRLIREMREKTNGQKPEFIVWENVPGAYTSHNGEDFRTVLEEIAKIKDGGICIPRPENGKWNKAGEILGDGYSIAWRTYDAQYWGVPQRRKRIYLVADFGGERAGKIQFESDRLCWDTSEGRREGQGTAGTPADDAGTPDEPTIRPNDQGGNRIDASEDVTGTLRAQDHEYPPEVMGAAGFLTEPSAKSRSIGYEEEISPTLRTDVVPAVFYGNHSQDTWHTGLVYGICSKDSHAMKSPNPYSGIYEAKTTRTLDTGGGDPARNQGGMIVLAPRVYDSHPNDGRITESKDGVSQTLSSRMGTGGNNTPIVVEPKPYTVGNGQINDAMRLDSLCHTLNCMHDPMIMLQPTAPETFPYIARRLMPIECCRLQGYPDWWTDGLETPEPTEGEVDRWVEIFETHRKATKPGSKGRTRNQIRKWLKDPQTDSAEYKMYGNSLAIPNAYHVLVGIAEITRRRIKLEPPPSGRVCLREVSEMGSGIFMKPARRCKLCGRMVWSEAALKTGYGCVCERKARAEQKAKEPIPGQMSIMDLFKTESEGDNGK